MYTQSLSGTILGVLRGSEGGTWVKIPQIWANIRNRRQKEWLNQKVVLTKVSGYAQIYTTSTSGTILGVLRGPKGVPGQKYPKMGKYQQFETKTGSIKKFALITVPVNALIYVPRPSGTILGVLRGSSTSKYGRISDIRDKKVFISKFPF